MHLDRALQLSLHESVPQIGAPSAWVAGFDGTGVKVAVVDSGIDAGHPDLAGKVVAAKNFSAAEGTQDAHGHGTHVASTIAGSGAASGGAYKGVAPGAELINARALDAKGWGSDSSVLAAVEWAVEAGADVVNLSLGATDTPGISLLEETVNKLSDQALFVIAAGNDGPAVTTVGSPGSAERALTVGAVDGKDALAAFSSRGPVVGDGAVKPEVTAPGVDITAAKFNSSGYQAMSGASMAAPHVAGRRPCLRSSTRAGAASRSRPTWSVRRNPVRTPRTSRAPAASTWPGQSGRPSSPSPRPELRHHDLAAHGRRTGLPHPDVPQLRRRGGDVAADHRDQGPDGPVHPRF